MSTLTILGAAYATLDVTSKVQTMVKNDVLVVRADVATFGDPWPGHAKSLVLVYRYGTQRPEVRIVRDNETETINEPNQSLQSQAAAGLTIYGAAYGLANVTAQVQRLVVGDTLDVMADNKTFVDSWFGQEKCMVVVYEHEGKPMLRAVKEYTPMRIGVDLTLKVLTAAYGPTIVTAEVGNRINNQEIHLTADNATFGDTWLGAIKSLVVTYQYGQEQPQMAIIQEGRALNVTYTTHRPFQPSADLQKLQILSAAYGLGDVTDRVAGLVHDNKLSVTANNETFQDPRLQGVQQTLVVTYQYGKGPPAMTVATQGKPLNIPKTA